MTKYNKTQLNPDTTFERHVYHRDQFAHYLRWTHVLKNAKIGQSILDFGCGTGNLYEVFYRNRYKPAYYLGLDIRKKTIQKARERWEKQDNCNFFVEDLCNMTKTYTGLWDIIVSFEVIEHLGKENGKKYLENLEKHANENTIILLSSPNYDPNVGEASNHNVDGENSERTFEEMKELLEDYFKIDNYWGTFASIKDYKEWVEDSAIKTTFEWAREYFDTNLLSVFMAPLIPANKARNVLWRLKKK